MPNIDIKNIYTKKMQKNKKKFKSVFLMNTFAKNNGYNFRSKQI
jgi:hypothetical protein